MAATMAVMLCMCAAVIPGAIPGAPGIPGGTPMPAIIGGIPAPPGIPCRHADMSTSGGGASRGGAAPSAGAAPVAPLQRR